MSEELEKKDSGQEEQYSLNDDRRVKVLSPGALVAKRFFRNAVAVTGLVTLVIMFIFSFIGGMITPYAEDQVFYRTDYQNKDYASVIENKEFRYVAAEDAEFGSVQQAQFVFASIQGTDTFKAKDTEYTITKESDDLYIIKLRKGGKIVALATYDIVSSSTGNDKLPFELQMNALTAKAKGEPTFEAQGETYNIDEEGTITKGGEEVGYCSRYIVQAKMNDVFLTKAFKDELLAEIEKGAEVFNFTDKDGVAYEYTLSYSPANNSWSVLQSSETHVFDTYSAPSKEHLLGTDRNGMDMLTRLMYGGRVSLVIGFIVVIIETVIGVVLGGIAGYFGGWIDNLIMRIVDIFYCIPSMPIILILGAAMDGMRVDPTIRMLYLMLLLGVLGWASIARLVRGQILSLREQEFMTATEACGIRVSRRIFKHLIPNVIPQLIVTCTMGLGSTILMEATLSFLGLGVKFPFASWGNIINDVNDTFVLTNYWFIWIPAGVCLMLTVLAFNLVGDGLRDAFDPKMKR